MAEANPNERTAARPAPLLPALWPRPLRNHLPHLQEAGVKPAPIRPEERAELLELYTELRGMHHVPFDIAIADPILLNCLRNTAEARRRTRAARDAIDPANFELVP